MVSFQQRLEHLHVAQNKMITDLVVTQLNESIRAMQFELQDMRDKVNDLTHRSPCVVEIQRVREASNTRVSELERDRDQKASKLAAIAQHRDELLESNKSITNLSHHYALELANEQAARHRVQEEKKAITQEYSQYRAETQPLVKKEEARKKAEEQKRRGIEIMEKGANFWNGLAEDPYKIRRAKP
jgi:hypothetical protein